MSFEAFNLNKENLFFSLQYPKLTLLKLKNDDTIDRKKLSIVCLFLLLLHERILHRRTQLPRGVQR